MRNSAKTATLESRFPLLAVENNCIVSKNADITACYKVQLPELFTVGASEYEAIHAAWHKAIKTLPDFTVVHKQDWYIKESYEPEIQNKDQSFLAKSYERHFNERPFLNHYCYLFLTKTTKERMAAQSNFSSLCKGSLLPKEIRDKETIHRFMEAVAQFERIMGDSGFIKLEPLSEEDIIGSEEKQGILDQYLTLSREAGAPLQDIALGSEQVRVGSKRLCFHTLSDTDDLPGTVSSDTRYEKLSTDRSDCRLSFAAPAGLLLGCNHIYNQYLFLDNSEESLRRFEKSARNMHSLARYSRANQIKAEYLKYLFKTVRKFFGEAIVVTQEVDDIIQSPIVKESIINNSDCKILLDQRKYMNKFDEIQKMLGLTDKEKAQVLSINMNNDPSRLYKEVWIGLGGTHSAVYATEVSLEEYMVRP
ncbi:TraG family conjugative transposon ATPase [Flavobacterium sp. LHD-85]|uniref:TraG family conjugative transposon ATPase n=1 Tax=Flavobacterium sp. LHD-85 TaxID=3071410 RepID=UPI0027E20DF0|nr:TraG family conjugative transposon ATPase [Flavobacterium sp. LHD-85]MDQ6532021.1 TraG family conjugative transposon ATPase [Flavobacterium sp. LHD-85]